MKPDMEKRGVSMTDNGPPPDVAAALYVGDVMHQRMRPFGHRFRYGVFSLLVDLDRLAEASNLSRLFSVNAPNVVSFHERDHAGARDIRTHADDLLAQAGLHASRILLVCYPRIFGYVFNPLAVYYAYDDRNDLIATIYEVRNTFGERHTYVCPVEPASISESGLRQTCDKLLYVSPFVGMDMRYHFRMLPPGREIRWRILETNEGGPLLAATFSGRHLPLTTPVLARLLARFPFLTAKIIGGIHWEALKLWLKGARYVPRHSPPPPISVTGVRPVLRRPKNDTTV
ncbi:DUF1365 domain-containing protein [Rhizobium sp. Root1220]|uniref:DUF1365 domain-containing protein n=1 Tax=Rhizobium sp. Root1220 TaxID=1736432 RepID=UPI0006F96EB1|nr:DUF1365 domain-containing protein [Rhizobium sp. Root1220]KQV83670.1 hypothetical protein ASC90_20115 [Rhizobium sp. Root1220]